MVFGANPTTPYVLPYIVKKSSLYLREADAERLRRLAERENRSQAEIVRAALEAYERRQSQSRDFLLSASWAGDGRSIADVSEEDLLEGFGS